MSNALGGIATPLKRLDGFAIDYPTPKYLRCSHSLGATVLEAREALLT